LPNKSYQKGYRLEAQIVKDYREEYYGKRYYCERNYESKGKRGIPYDGIIMGHGLNVIWSAKNWKRYPKNIEKFARKDCIKMIEEADLRGCEAWFFYKAGRGPHNYMKIELNSRKK